MQLVLASNNAHKATEIRRLLPAVDLLMPADLGVDFDYPEYGATYRANAHGKARHLYDLVQRPTIADDSGLEVAALGGAPGVRSARFGPPGAALDDAGRSAHLLRLLEGQERREAAFVCCIVVLFDPQRWLTVQETPAGTIARAPRGDGGFGYDPVFVPAPVDAAGVGVRVGVGDQAAGPSMAQLSGEEKDRRSHRGRALRRCQLLLGADLA